MRGLVILGLVLVAMFFLHDVALGHTTVKVYNNNNCGCCCGDDSPRWRRDTSSEALRAGKTVSLTIGTDGYAAGLYLGNNALLEALIDSEYEEDEDDEEEWEPSVVRTGATLKLFRGNSFYSQFGVKHDHFTRENSSNPDLLSTTYATFGIGNQWQWDYLTVGVRWLDLYVPVMNRVKVASVDADYEMRAKGPRTFSPHVDWFGLYAGFAF